ncbi:MAG: hypothetical protein ACXVLQ_13670 [Bacteriovorax sp.]
MIKKILPIFILPIAIIVLIIPLHAETKKPDDFPSTEYRVGLFQDLVVDMQKITHIIVVGSAVKEDSDQFFQSGLSRAYRYKELYPDHQVIIMSSPDVVNTTDEQVFANYNVLVIKKVLEKFTASNMLNEMMEYPQIASFDFFGHSSPWALKIGDMNAAFYPGDNESALRKLRDHFLPNAYITLNACNTGFLIAPELSEIMHLPVSGALTSSVFERIESDGLWYKEDDWTRGNYVETNKFSYNQTVPCKMGLCNRMKPSRFEYHSVWGHFKEGGLSFNKFFCKFNNSDGRCERGMANSLLGFPSVMPITIDSDIVAFKAVAYDWLCSTSIDKTYFNNCVAGIDDAIARYDLVYQSHPGNELMCDFKTCNAKVICDDDPINGPKPGSCHLKTPINPEPTNVAREMLSLIKGFENLKQYVRATNR